MSRWSHHRAAASIIAALLACVAVRADGAPPSFAGFWEVRDFHAVTRPEYDQSNLTDEALANLKKFREAFPEGKSPWPADLCLFHGMPWTMLTRARTYATEIYQTADRIVLFHEGMDLVRHIRLDTTVFPEGYAPSNQGYSIGRWEGDELVIETRGLIGLNPYSDLQRSDQARIVERWRFIKDGTDVDRLDVEIVVHDPVVYKRPARGHKTFYRMPPGTVLGGYNCNNTKWDEFVDKTLAAQKAAAAPAR